MKHKLLYLSLLLLGGLCACQSEWDKHYLLDDNKTGENANATIWEYIAGNPAYSEFVALAKASGMDSVLTKDQQMTLWIPDNESMAAVAGLADEEKGALIRNHLNYTAVKATRFADGQRLKTLAAKNVYLTGNTGVWTIDHHAITPDVMYCNNGVIHEIKGVLTPRKNIFEHLATLGDEYSTVRDTILNSCVKTFRPDLSFPLGVDDVGNTIYDSVFIYVSKWLAMGDIREENEEFTMFLPDNEKIRKVYEEVRTYYPEIEAKDSLLINNWIYRALVYEGKIEDYTAKKSIKSAFGLEWRTDIQQVNTAARRELSNGYIYPVDYFRVPHFLFLKEVTTFPIYYPILEKQRPELIAEYFKTVTSQPEKTKPFGAIDAGKAEMFAVYDDNLKANNSVMTLEWTSIDKNRFGEVVAVPVVPGRYKLSFSGRSYNCGNTRVTVNGILPQTASGTNIPYVNMADGKFNYMLGEIGYITIPESAGVNPVRIALQSGPSISDPFAARLVVRQMLFVPDGDNY